MWNSIDDSWLVVLAAPFLSAALTHALRRPARQFGLVDHPGGRKQHAAPTPLVGGLAIYLTIMIEAVLLHHLPGFSWSLVAALIVTVLIGVADDAHEIGHRSKFFAQLIAALIVVFGTSMHVASIGDLLGFGQIGLGKWSYLVTGIAIIGLMNAINMIDGLDGLAGMLTLQPVLALSGLAYATRRPLVGMELLVLAGAIVGFLYFNLRTPWRSRAAAFMGDTGGLLLGLLLAWYSVQIAGAVGSPVHPITVVWILAMPLLDMGSVMLLRVLQHKSPFHADRQHLHYVLVDCGYSVGQVVAIMSGLSLCYSVVAVVAERAGVPEFVMFYGFVGLWAVNLVGVRQPERVHAFARRLIHPRGAVAAVAAIASAESV